MTMPISTEVQSAKDLFRSKAEFISHEEVAARIGVKYPSPEYYSVVGRALHALVLERVVYENRRRKVSAGEPGGYYLCDDSAAIKTNGKYGDRIVKSARRGTRRLNNRIWGVTNLSKEDAITATAQAVIYSQVESIARKQNFEQVRKVMRSTDTTGTADMFEAMQKAGLKMFNASKRT